MQVFWLTHLHSSHLPMGMSPKWSHLQWLRLTTRLQRRYRAGFKPASLLAVSPDCCRETEHNSKYSIDNLYTPTFRRLTWMSYWAIKVFLISFLNTNNHFKQIYDIFVLYAMMIITLTFLKNIFKIFMKYIIFFILYIWFPLLSSC